MFSRVLPRPHQASRPRPAPQAPTSPTLVRGDASYVGGAFRGVQRGEVVMRCPTCYGRIGFWRSPLVWTRWQTMRCPCCRERLRRGRLYRRGRADAWGHFILLILADLFFVPTPSSALLFWVFGPIGVLWLSARYARLKSVREG